MEMGNDEDANGWKTSMMRARKKKLGKPGMKRANVHKGSNQYSDPQKE
jgi:hypothetical protein